MLENKVAVVTGFTSGIGLGIARSLASAGAKILLNGFGDPAEIEKPATELGTHINVASAHGLVGSPHKSAYVAAKHGVVGLTKVVALETATNSHNLQCRVPRLGADADGAEADR